MKRIEWLTERKVAVVCVVILVGVSVIPVIKQAGFFKNKVADVAVQSGNGDILQYASVEQAHSPAPAPNPATVDQSYPDDGLAYMYKYVVEAGDSYSSVVRKAIDAHIAEAKMAASDAAKTAAVAAIVQAAHAPLVEVGEQVAIKKDVVANALAAAMQ